MASSKINETSALASVAAAEESLRQTENKDFTTLKSYAKPPLCCLAVIEGVGILLNPSKGVWEWTDDKKLMAGNRTEFLEQLFNLDKDNININQLTRLKSILARDDCQSDNLANTSLLCLKLCLWLRAIVEYATQRQEVH